MDRLIQQEIRRSGGEDLKDKMSDILLIQLQWRCICLEDLSYFMEYLSFLYGA